MVEFSYLRTQYKTRERKKSLHFCSYCVRVPGGITFDKFFEKEQGGRCVVYLRPVSKLFSFFSFGNPSSISSTEPATPTPAPTPTLTPAPTLGLTLH
jgi:hypothetical protein